jgi:hypothetical protein
MEERMDDRPGCLVGLLKLTFLNWIYEGLQRNVGFGKGGCTGCGCGMVLLILFILILISIIFGTDWFKLVQAFQVV